MIFGKKNNADTTDESLSHASHRAAEASSELLYFAPEQIANNHTLREKLQAAIGKLILTPGNVDRIESSAAVLSIFQEPEELDVLLDAVLHARKRRDDGTPYLVIVLGLRQLADFGDWLGSRAAEDSLEGIRLILANDSVEIVAQLQDKLQPVYESAFIKMPRSPEINTSDFSYFYTISPSLRETVRLCGEYAENGVNRIYLLGGPGSGKTSLAYYYFLRRNRGRFISINLNSESTGDKAEMKSLLCGHVTGAFPGASSREGALSLAQEGVCFLDESHGVSGVVMQVLMEVLDSGQYMPFGASAKRKLESAVIFASNRSWEHLRSQIALDEHARLGAMILNLFDLTERREDLIAVLAVSFAKFRAQCTTWSPPIGLTPGAWQRILLCPWRGNVRTLIRCFETAAVQYASSGLHSGFIEQQHIEDAIALWEPEEHESYKLYTSIQE